MLGMDGQNIRQQLQPGGQISALPSIFRKYPGARWLMVRQQQTEVDKNDLKQFSKNNSAETPAEL